MRRLSALVPASLFCTLALAACNLVGNGTASLTTKIKSVTAAAKDPTTGTARAGIIAIGFQIADELTTNLVTQGGLTQDQALVITNGSKDEVTTAGTVNISTLALADLKPIEVAAGPLVKGAFLKLNDAAAGLPDAAQRGAIAKIIMSSTFGSLQGKVDDLDVATLKSLQKGMVGTAVRTLNDGGLGGDAAPDAIKAVTSGAVEALGKTIGSDDASDAAAQVVSGAIENLGSAGFDPELIQGMVSSAAEGVVSGLTAAGCADPAAAAGAVAQASVTSLKGLSLSTEKMLQATEGAASGAVGALSRAGVPADQIAAAAQGVASASVGALKNAGVSDTNIANAAGAVATGAVSALKTAGVTADAIAAAAGAIATGAVGALKSSGATNIGAAAGAIATGAVGALKKSGATDLGAAAAAIATGAVSGLKTAGVTAADIGTAAGAIATGAVGGLKTAGVATADIGKAAGAVATGAVGALKNSGATDLGAAAGSITNGAVGALKAAGVGNDAIGAAASTIASAAVDGLKTAGVTDVTGAAASITSGATQGLSTAGLSTAQTSTFQTSLNTAVNTAVNTAASATNTATSTAASTAVNTQVTTAPASTYTPPTCAMAASAPATLIANFTATNPPFGAVFCNASTSGDCKIAVFTSLNLNFDVSTSTCKTGTGGTYITPTCASALSAPAGAIAAFVMTNPGPGSVFCNAAKGSPDCMDSSFVSLNLSFDSATFVCRSGAGGGYTPPSCASAISAPASAIAAFTATAPGFGAVFCHAGTSSDCMNSSFVSLNLSFDSATFVCWSGAGGSYTPPSCASAISAPASAIAVFTATAPGPGAVFCHAGTSSDCTNASIASLNLVFDSGLFACKIGTGGGGDSTPPMPGAGGNISISSVTATSILLDWTTGSDNFDTAGGLQYLVYQSMSPSIGSVSQAESNGTPIGIYSTNINQYSIGGLTPSTLYYFTVLIKDSAGNRSVYNLVSQITGTSLCNAGDTTTTCYITTPKIIPSGQTLNLSGNLVISTGGSLQSANPAEYFFLHGANLTLSSGGTINGNVIATFNTITLDTGTAIDATGRGFPGGANCSVGAPQSGHMGGGSSDNCGGGTAYGGGGAGYGDGGLPGSVNYGAGVRSATRHVTDMPTGMDLDFGSAGGAANSDGSHGGSGGGMIALIATNSISVYGQIRANGADGVDGGGGGGGGVIYLDSPMITGSGQIQANGGNAGMRDNVKSGGGGGGGLIYTTTDSMMLSPIAHGGIGAGTAMTAANVGSAGVVYSKGSSVNRYMFIDNGGIATSRRTRLDLQESLSVDSLAVSNGAMVTPLTSGVQSMAINNLSVDATSTLSANGFGASGGNGGATGSGPAGGYAYGAGAANAGAGGRSVVAGTSRAPVTYNAGVPPVGSGGGSGQLTPGGPGGGNLIVFISGSAVINGTVSANGDDGVSEQNTISSGGGSGGYIHLDVGQNLSIGSSALIMANGGAGGGSLNLGSGSGGGGGGGGGGFLGIVAQSLTCAAGATIVANGGAAGQSALGISDDGEPGNGGQISVKVNGSPVGLPSGLANCTFDQSAGFNQTGAGSAGPWNAGGPF